MPLARRRHPTSTPHQYTLLVHPTSTPLPPLLPPQPHHALSRAYAPLRMHLECTTTGIPPAAGGGGSGRAPGRARRGRCIPRGGGGGPRAGRRRRSAALGARPRTRARARAGAGAAAGGQGGRRVAQATRGTEEQEEVRGRRRRQVTESRGRNEEVKTSSCPPSCTQCHADYTTCCVVTGICFRICLSLRGANK